MTDKTLEAPEVPKQKIFRPAIIGLVSGLLAAALGTSMLKGTGSYEGVAILILYTLLLSGIIILVSAISGINAVIKKTPFFDRLTVEAIFGLAFSIGMTFMGMMNDLSTTPLLEVLKGMAIGLFVFGTIFVMAAMVGFIASFGLAYLMQAIIRALSPSKPTI